MYLKFRLRKMSLVQLERRFCMPVHILTSPDFEIPTYVLAYLSKGGKFVADRCASSAAKVLTSVSALERSLNTAVFFDRHALEPTFFRRCRLRTAWKPKEDPIISAYGRLLREELSSYSPRELVKNEDFIDKAARKWLYVYHLIPASKFDHVVLHVNVAFALSWGAILNTASLRPLTSRAGKS